MSDPVEHKLDRLKGLLRERRSVLAAFSGGLDSSFLLAAARDVLGERAAAFTVVSPFIPQRERRSSAKTAERLEARHFVVFLDTLSVPVLANNPPHRCYECKKLVYGKGLEISRDQGFECFMDGTNADDLNVHRPGRRAVEELGVVTPLADAGLGREEIRILSRRWNLPTWDKPPISCLATRFPYGTHLTREILETVDHAEELLDSLGFPEVRVRVHGEVARIEVATDHLESLTQPDVRHAVVDGLKGLGIRYVALDLEGFRSGSMDV